VRVGSLRDRVQGRRVRVLMVALERARQAGYDDGYSDGQAAAWQSLSASALGGAAEKLG
jgi:hypothetical protein